MLFELSAGYVVPRHAHKGKEIVLVFEGGFDDSRGTFVRGDMEICGGELEHTLRVHADGPCICLAVYEQRLIPRTIGGWLFKLLRNV